MHAHLLVASGNGVLEGALADRNLVHCRLFELLKVLTLDPGPHMRVRASQVPDM